VNGLVVDLFAGPGGWDQGLRMAGYTGPLVGLEHDRSACLTAAKAGHWRIQADVSTYPTAPFVGKTWGLIASPPCPSFSMAGSGAGKDDVPNVLRLIADYATGRAPGDYEWADIRSALTAQPMRWAIALRPCWIALEQVPPVLPIWRYVAELLRGGGYRVWCGVLSAEEYGVPQTRKRAILVASLHGQVGPPAPTNQAYVSGRDPQSEPDLFGDLLPLPVSMADALGWRGATQNMQHGAGMLERYGERPDRDMIDPSFTITAGSAGSGPRLRWMMESAHRRKVNDKTQPRSIDAPALTVAFGHSDMQWTRERPATTVCGDSRVWPPGHKVNQSDRDRLGSDADRYGDRAGTESVRVSVVEAGVLQSFPAGYPWQGTKSAQYLQVGNAVPPRLAAAVLAQFIPQAEQVAA